MRVRPAIFWAIESRSGRASRLTLPQQPSEFPQHRTRSTLVGVAARVKRHPELTPWRHEELTPCWLSMCMRRSFGGDGLGKQSGTTLFSQAIAVAADRYDVTVVQQAVQDRSSHHRITEHCRLRASIRARAAEGSAATAVRRRVPRPGPAMGCRAAGRGTA